MPGLSPGRLNALRALVETAPNPTLRLLEMAFDSQDASTAYVHRIIAAERSDRITAEAVFAPLSPLFVPRADEVRQVLLPKAGMRPLWRALKALHPKEATLAEAACLSGCEGADAEILDALCALAAQRLRSDPALAETVGRGDPAMARTVADFLDLAPITRAAAARLPDWLGRPTVHDLAALKLAFKDAVAVSPDAAVRLCETLLGHMPQACDVLRLIAVLMDRPSERYVASSEMADFGERLLDAVERKIASALAFSPRLGVAGAEAAAADAAFAYAAMTTFEQELELSRDGPWGSRVAEGRRRLTEWAETQLNAVEAAVDKALPMTLTKLAGRMHRPAPKLTEAPNPERSEPALALMTLLHRLRTSATSGGYGALTARVAKAVGQRVETYVEEVLALLCGEEAADQPHAWTYLELCAELIGMAYEPRAADVVRRRAVVARVTVETASQAIA